MVRKPDVCVKFIIHFIIHIYVYVIKIYSRGVFLLLTGVWTL